MTNLGNRETVVFVLIDIRLFLVFGVWVLTILLTSSGEAAISICAETDILFYSCFRLDLGNKENHLFLFTKEER